MGQQREFLLISLPDRFSDINPGSGGSPHRHGLNQQEKGGRHAVGGNCPRRHMAENRVLHRSVQSPQRADQKDRHHHFIIIHSQEAVRFQISPPGQLQHPLLLHDKKNKDQKFRDPGSQRPDGGSLHPQPRSPEMAVNQSIIDRAVDQKGPDRKAERDAHRSHASEGRQQNLR